MPNETIKDVLAARDRLAAKLGERFSARRNVAVGTEQALLESFSARLEAAKSAKQQALERHEEEIRYYSEVVARLKASIAQGDKAVAGKTASKPKAARAVPSKPDGGARQAKTKRSKKPPAGGPV